MGLGAFSELQMRSKGENGRSHNSFLYHPPNGTLGLVALDDDIVEWLKTTALNIC